jgi:CBS domain-containing protein
MASKTRDTAVAERPRASTLTAQDVMTANLLFVDEDLTLSELADFLTDHQISGAVVRNSSGAPIGVVSLSDLAAARSGPSSAAPPSPIRGFYGLDWELDEWDAVTVVAPDNEATAGDIMTPEVVSVDRTAPIAEVARTMLEGHLHRVLVQDRETLVGIVSTSDLLRLLADEE